MFSNRIVGFVQKQVLLGQVLLSFAFVCLDLTKLSGLSVHTGERNLINIANMNARFYRKLNTKIKITILSGIISCSVHAQESEMDKMWNGQAKNNIVDTQRGKTFRDGRYAMFIHWGLFSQLANKWEGKTYYGIGEWIMNKKMANISPQDYMPVSKYFNPKSFNADSIVHLAKDAGMKYIVITSKHHDGFAMFHSKYTKFNIVDATPFKRDPMKEIAQACKKAGLGFGFYYSQNQDWTTPGGHGGPTKDETGKTVTFDDYFYKRCLPEIEQITTAYGPLAVVWFDTPGNIEKKYVEKLVEVVHKNQPGAYVSGRVGHGLGDYTTFGDMEVPQKNIGGIWESVDVTNDSWGFAWYDNNWKTPKQILTNTLSTIARGGNYMLNIGPDNNGAVPLQAAIALRSAGAWIKRYPNIIYKSKASPWQQPLPWGDAVINGQTISLLIYNWPTTGSLFLPGLQSAVSGIKLLKDGKKYPLKFKKKGQWHEIEVPSKAPEHFVSVIEIEIKGMAKVDINLPVDPQQETTLAALFADASKVQKNSQHWMEKFGEWKHVDRLTNWEENGTAIWTVNVAKPGYYQASLKYTGIGRLVWNIDNGEHFNQNEQSSSSVYTWYPIGWLHFSKPGTYKISVSLKDGERSKTSLSDLKLQPVML